MSTRSKRRKKATKRHSRKTSKTPSVQIGQPKWLVLLHLTAHTKPIPIGLAANSRESDSMARKYLGQLPGLTNLYGVPRVPVRRITEYLEIMATRLGRPVARAEWVVAIESVLEFPRVRIEPYQKSESGSS